MESPYSAMAIPRRRRLRNQASPSINRARAKVTAPSSE